MGEERKRLRAKKAEEAAAKRAAAEKEKWLKMTYEEFEEQRWKEIHETEEKEKAEIRRQLGIKKEEENARTVEWQVIAALRKGSPEAELQGVFNDRRSHESTLARYQGQQMDVAKAELHRHLEQLSLTDLRKRVAGKRGGIVPAEIIEGSPTEKKELLELLCNEGPQRDHVLAAVKHNGWALRWATESQRADAEIVLEAVKTAGSSLELAAPSLRADRNIVLTAVCQDGRALQYAAQTFRSDEEVVRVAVEQCGQALQYASDELRSKQRFWLSLEALAGARLL